MLSATKPLSENLPAHGCRHVAIIMDGNGRWAKKQGKIRAFGHKAGAKSVRRAVSFAANNGIDALTLYAFSSENWNRPAQEVSALMELFVWALDSEVKNLHRHNVRLRIIGDISRFNSRLQERIRKSEAITAQNTGLTLNIAANYGGRWDIVEGVRQLAQQVQDGLLRPEQIDEEMLGQQICMHELAPVDLVIRTGESIELVIFCCGKLPMPNFTLRMFSGPISMNKTLKVRCMPLLIVSVVSAAPSPVMKKPDGGRFC